jgi:hypothetical protein
MYWDFITGQHGNYQVMRNQRSSVRYCTKQGPWNGDLGYIAFNIDPEAILKKKNGRFTLIAKRMQQGETIKDVDKSDPGFVLQHMRKLKEYQHHLSVERQRNVSKPPLVSNCFIFSATPQASDLEILGWILANLFLTRKFKQRQLFLYGPPSTGKTSLLLALENYLRIYWMSSSSGWYDDFEEGAYDLIVIDEFKGMKIRFLNALLQGTQLTIPRRGNDLKYRENLPVVILSNLDLEVIYHKTTATLLSALISRLQIVNVKSLLNLRIQPPSPATTSSSETTTSCINPYIEPPARIIRLSATILLQALKMAQMTPTVGGGYTTLTEEDVDLICDRMSVSENERHQLVPVRTPSPTTVMDLPTSEANTPRS